MARVTVKQLRGEAKRRLLECGNGKTMSRMNKRELLNFISCIHHPNADNLGADDLGASVAAMYKEPKRRKRKKAPAGWQPVESEPDDLSDISLGGRGVPDTYREFVKAMLPHIRERGVGPQAAIKTAAMMWRKHKAQRGAGLALTGTQDGAGWARDAAGVAGGVGSALGAAGAASAATGVGLAATPFLELGAAGAGGVALGLKGVDYIQSLFS